VRIVFQIKDLAGRGVCVLTLVAGLGAFGAPFPAYALEAPFDIDAGGWVSSRTYEDNLRRHNSKQKKEEKKEAPLPQPVVSKPTSDEAVAVFRPPTMPALNKGFVVQVNSTEDEKEKRILLFTEPPSDDVSLPEKKWKATSSKDVFSKLGEDEDKELLPLNVRMSFLPAQGDSPVPFSTRDSAQKKARELLMKEAEEKERKKREDAEARAALEDFKKQQLDAIQSDRQTLTLLQNAIRSLGLTKELGFMTKQDSALVEKKDQSSAPTAVRAPTKTSTR